MPALSQETVRTLISLGGAAATSEEVDGATRLYNTLAEQLAEVPSKALEYVEPQYIQPARRGRPTS